MTRMPSVYELIRRVRLPGPLPFVRWSADRHRSTAVPASTIERWCVAVLAIAAATALAVAIWHAEAPTRQQWVLTAVFGALVTVAWLAPLPFAFKTDLCLDTSVLLAAVLLLEPVQAIALAAAGVGLAQVVRRNTAIETLFNTSQVAIQVAAAAAILTAADWRTDELAFKGLRDAGAVMLAAAAMFAFTDLAVALMVAAQSGMNPVQTWLDAIRQTRPGDAAAQLAQVGLGTSAAVLVHTSPWLLTLLLLPAVAVHLSLATAQRERRRAAEALRNTEAALAEAERIAHLGSWEWDLTTGRVSWSDETYRILGVGSSCATPTWAAFLHAVHPDDRGAVDRCVHEAIASGGSFFREHRIQHPDGWERTVYAQGEVIRDAAGVKRRLVATLQDVTERKRAEQARDELLASLSHDLKSPLTVIRGQAQLMRRRLDRNPSPEHLREGLELIDTTARAMATQITELLEFAQQEMAGTMPAIPLDLGELVRERAALYQQSTERHRIQVETPPDGLVASGNRRQFCRVIDNLLANAIKYSPDGGEIVATVMRERASDADWAVISVTDHGIGIPPEDLARIFNPYQRGSNVGRIEGSGIGLAGAKHVIALHGGTIHAESAPGEGTTIRLRLPIGG